MDRTRSSLYSERTVTGNSLEDRTNAELAKEYKSKLDAEKEADVMRYARDAGIQEGMNNAYMDVVKQLNAPGSPFKAVQEGSPQAYEMDANMVRGQSYQPNNEGISDAVANLLSRSAEGVSDWLAQPDPEPTTQSDLQKQQEFEQMQYDSEQAGLAELEQLLSNQQH